MQYTKSPQKQEQHFLASLQKQIEEFNNNSGARLQISLTDGQSLRKCLDLYSIIYELGDWELLDHIIQMSFDALEKYFFTFGSSEKVTDEDKEEYFQTLSYDRAHEYLFSTGLFIKQIVKAFQHIERIDFLRRKNSKEDAA